MSFKVSQAPCVALMTYFAMIVRRLLSAGNTVVGADMMSMLRHKQPWFIKTHYFGGDGVVEGISYM